MATVVSQLRLRSNGATLSAPSNCCAPRFKVRHLANPQPLYTRTPTFFPPTARAVVDARVRVMYGRSGGRSRVCVLHYYTCAVS